MITKQMMEEKLADFVASSQKNTISESVARSAESVGLVLYDAPVLNVADAHDPLFETLRQPEVVGPHILMPDDWMPGAKTIVSFFLPYTERVRNSNKQNFDWPSTEWLHGRIEGFAFVAATCAALVSIIEEEGYNAMSPTLDPRLGPKFHFERKDDPNPPPKYNSRWPERHAAFIAGLGTFGLSKGLITRRGMAGRIGSVITDAPFSPDSRDYTETYEYCTQCGACIKNCPVGAIDFENGKSNPKCSAFIDKILETEGGTYYGCGKCQVSVPCERKIPNR